MARWTIKELENISDIDFAIAILNERKAGLNHYAPLANKINKVIGTLTQIKNEKGNQLKD